MFKKYFCIKQHDISDCAAACLATISKQYGLKKSITRIREIAGTNKEGTNVLGIIKAAKSLGFIAKGVKCTEEQLDSKLPFPAIAHVLKDKVYHFVVIHRIKKDRILVADPAEGIVSYTKEDFFNIWTNILVLIIPDESFEKGNETTGLFARFLSLIFPHKKLIAEIFVSSIIYTILGILGAFYFKYLIDEILVNGLLDTLNIIGVGMIILTVFKVLLNAFRRHLLLHFSQKIDISLIFNYYQHVLKLPMSFFDSRKVGEILSRLNDASKIRAAISGAALSVLIDTLMILGGGVVLYLQSWQLFLVALFFIPFSIAVVWAFTTPFQKMHRKVMQEAADTESYLVESLNGIPSIKAMNAESQAINETENKFIKVIKSTFKLGWMRNLQSSLQTILTLVGGIVILWVGGLHVIKGNITVGQLITFNALLAYFFEPIRNLIGLQPSLQEAYVASDRLGEILDLDLEAVNEDKLLSPGKFYGKITLKNIDFKYRPGKNILEKINFEIKKGEKIALVGESGSGKTTLVKLLLKYYKPEEGDILFDDNNIKDIQTESLRERVGYVPQDVFIFSGTIRDNIAFGYEDADYDDIIAASKSANTHDFINEMSLRYDTLVGERGATLSGGQRQRIALARAILKKPDILILDEATSNLDSIAEKAIHEAIEKISRKKTTIIIAHRLSTIARCDRIVVMDRGKIVEIGSHTGLLNKKGKYYELWQGQLDFQPEEIRELL